MSQVRYTISCIIKNKDGECLVDSGWQKDCARAILFTPQQAEATVKALSQKQPTIGVAASYVIQDNHFNYDDGKGGWAYNLSDAKLYATAREAEAKIKA